MASMQINRPQAMSVLVVALLVSVSIVHASDDHTCLVSTFEKDAGAAIEACTSRLAAQNLSEDERAHALRIRGRSFRKVERRDDARRDFVAALQLTPNDPDLLVRVGWIAIEENQVIDAGAYARRALHLKTDDAAAYDLLGASLAAVGLSEFAAAKAAYDEAIRLDASNPHFRNNRLRSMYRYARWAEVVKDADALLAFPPELITKPTSLEFDRRMTSFRTSAWLHRAYALGRLGRVGEAQRAYDELVAIEPGPLSYTWRAKFTASQQVYRIGEPAPSQASRHEDLDKALALDPDFWRALYEKADLAFYAHDYDAAIQGYTRVLKQHSDIGEVRWSYAVTLRKIGKVEQATEEAVNAFRSDPGFMSGKVSRLRKFGYVGAIAEDTDPRPILYDAARACMLDENCT